MRHLIRSFLSSVCWNLADASGGAPSPEPVAAEAPDFGTLTGPQLVEAYNEMVLTALDLGVQTAQPVKRFSGVDAGRARCARMHAMITDLRADAARDLRSTAQRAAEPSKTDPVAIPPANDPLHEEAVNAAARAGAPNQEPTGSAVESEDEMAKKRKAGRKPARKGAAGGAARKRAEGPTLSSYREEYNALVPAAKKAGIKWAKHHTSEFESKVKGAAQVARLQKAIKDAK